MTARTRTRRLSRAGLLAAAALLALAGPARADGEGGDGEESPAEAGTTFRTATVLDQGQHGTATASTGDYLYWVFPVAAGQTATAEATVTLPDSATRSGPSTWRIDVYDGLRRRQACVSGAQTAVAAQEDAEISLDCTLRTVRSWAEPWSNDPLPGAYYLRLTVTDLPDRDLGLPIGAEAWTTVEDEGGAGDFGGELAAPLLPVGSAGSVDENAGSGDGAGDGTEEDGDQARYLAAVPEPEGGWSGGWWTDRWLWTAGGGVLGAVAAVGGYLLVRGPRRPSAG
ncbi:hypothetical protein [Streptomyces hoynatensis]|uniref:Peptidase n=1 Tax=Streptomyces hoynatensis TaxID=1141874 RepID=A0A3A9Z3I1_9ACTN|nr:hypothetical protein [Streptomyces hoynatensis]RKN42384.1 hypothetical protein D7294_13265 [Streptomyces hoynatensis]